MKRTITTITLKPEVKKKALMILESKGMKLSAVVELYLKNLIEEDSKNETDKRI